MRYLKFVLPAILLALSANVSASTVNLTNYGSYTSDASTSLDWIRWETTKNQSYNYVSSQFGTGGLYEGWQYATASQAEQFLGNFGLSYSLSWADTTLTAWDELTLYMGFDSDYSSNAYYLYGMAESSGSITNTYAQYSDANTYYRTRLLNSQYTKDISYEFLGSFLVRSSEPVVPSAVPVPAAAWLFGSALLGFFGFSRRKANV